MILQTSSWDDGSEGLRIDHGDGSATVVCERPDGTGWSVHLTVAALRSIRLSARRESFSRAGRASAARRKALRPLVPPQTPDGAE